MRLHTKNIIMSVILFSTLITSASGQDYYYGDTKYLFSEHLKAGMEFTWEFKKFSFEFINSSLGFNQVTSTASETVTEEQTTLTVTDAPSSQTTTETSEEYYFEFPEIPDVPVGTLYTIKLLKDIGNLTDDYIYSEFDDEMNYYKEYFDISISSGNAETLIPFFGINGFIYTSVIEYDNGTRANQFEVQYQEEMKWREEYSDAFNDSNVGSVPEFSIVDGVYIESMQFVDGNITISTSQRTDIETGILLSVTGSISLPQYLYEVDVELYETKGIDLNNLDRGETLALPISTIFVYTLFVIPIIINKLKSKNNK
ncbi:MAG: hypothetical protein HeimC2_26380 [Candidatus Heimdallarchaeota archaeon LC_2]|nr:MAG: hypothetical protein HeimC2_26380 [Candidatus Heimdallarchaeota archaeon LC_2]